MALVGNKVDLVEESQNPITSCFKDVIQDTDGDQDPNYKTVPISKKITPRLESLMYEGGSESESNGEVESDAARNDTVEHFRETTQTFGMENTQINAKKLQ